MTGNEYQQEALKTAVYPEEYKITYPILGLNGEAGEVADKYKKIIRDKNGVMSDEDRKNIALEICDCAWYIAVLANDLGYTLEEIMQMNIDKLRSRKERNCISGSGDNR